MAIKRVLDWSGALLLLVLTSPLILLAALLVKLTSRGPVLYTQTRLGRHGVPFQIYKIRTMVHDCERLTSPCWTTTHDPYVTAVGCFLRLTHLDELPQLWNALRGERSLVGPRPERPEFVPLLAKAIPGYRQRLLIRPGVTGLAQVQLPADTDLESVRRKLARDLYYLRRLCLARPAHLALHSLQGGGKLFYEPAAVVGHRVPLNRLHRRWFWSRCYWGHRGEARKAPGYGVSAYQLLRTTWHLGRALRSLFTHGRARGATPASVLPPTTADRRTR